MSRMMEFTNHFGLSQICYLDKITDLMGTHYHFKCLIVLCKYLHRCMKCGKMEISKLFFSIFWENTIKILSQEDSIADFKMPDVDDKIALGN